MSISDINDGMLKTIPEDIDNNGVLEYTKFSNNEILLADGNDDNCETDDESDDNELETFLLLMNKAEKKNEKRRMRKMKNFSSRNNDWRSVKLDQDDPDEDTSDTEDEDDHTETNKFMSLMTKAKEKNSMVKLTYVNGKMQMVKMKNGHEGELMYRAMKDNLQKKIPSEHRSLSQPIIQKENNSKTSCGDGNDPTPTSTSGQQKMVTISRIVDHDQDSLQRRKEEFRRKASREGATVSQSSGGKRKFSERMTLAEASAEDFDDGQDYVNFLQDKLQGIKIKLVK